MFYFIIISEDLFSIILIHAVSLCFCLFAVWLYDLTFNFSLRQTAYATMRRRP